MGHVLTACGSLSPAAAATRVTAPPRLVSLLSVAFAVTSMVGGILPALGSSIPTSPYVTTISFTFYLPVRRPEEVARLFRHIGSMAEMEMIIVI
ncbi:ABC transporter permease family protein [Nonomuraea phyllanthi]|uniref:hypothetical protein n=1 Tax=Nonomuraea phyllanthi TaxID=2219224 RepID=UPI001D015BE8|nr:hypothetical protein [Nonomuraea phyllanthi]